MAKAKTRRSFPGPKLVRQDGALCATFVNTASAKRQAFETYDDLLLWGRHNGALGAGGAERLAVAAAERPEAAEAAVARARELRVCLTRILLALADGGDPAAADIGELNTALGAALSCRRLVLHPGGYRWGWTDAGEAFDSMLWPVLTSAADVLTTKYHRKVRRCAGPDCDLIFVDRTPGSPRKWCDEKDCGHRVRSARHYRKTVKPRQERIKAQVRAERLFAKRT
jgi:predicted RNA-binding Zn ribbon-like protein